LQLNSESLSEQPIYANEAFAHRLDNMRGNATSFAFEYIKYELAKSLIPENSHAPDGRRCLCKLRVNYRIPCRHILRQYDGVVPLNIIHQRWRIYYLNGKGRCKHLMHIL
jgi:replication initiation and membrane attachment protein DnaB